MSDARLLLKWGTIKGWSNMSPEQIQILQRWVDEGVFFLGILIAPKEWLWLTVMLLAIKAEGEE